MTDDTPARELASPGQMRALHAAARDAGSLHADIKALAAERFCEVSLSHLNWRQARALIEHYQAASALHTGASPAPAKPSPATAAPAYSRPSFGGPLAKRAPQTTATPPAAPVQPSPEIDAGEIPTAEERNRIRAGVAPDYNAVRGQTPARRSPTTSRHYSSERHDVDPTDPPVCRPPDAPQPSREQE